MFPIMYNLKQYFIVLIKMLFLFQVCITDTTTSWVVSRTDSYAFTNDGITLSNSAVTESVWFSIKSVFNHSLDIV